MGGQWRRRGCTEFIVALLEPSPAASLAEQGEAWAKGENEGEGEG